MKRLSLILLCLVILFSFSSCPAVTQFPDMVEYTEDEVLAVAKEKYGIVEWLLTNGELRGKMERREDGSFSIWTHRDTVQFGSNFLGGDNLVAALSAFAGKNGGHDIQGMYSDFLCYVAIGKTNDGKVKYIYYNVNLHKTAKVADTVGASDYGFDVLPTEITKDTFSVQSDWQEMARYLNKHFADRKAANYTYSGEHLSLVYHDLPNSLVTMEFYKESGKIVYDLYYTKNYNKPDERRLVYSSSERYGVIYNYYGLDISQYVEVSHTVEQSTEQESCVVLRGTAKIKETVGEILYSSLSYRAEYYVLKDGEAIGSATSETRSDVTELSVGYMFDKIDGINHAETARFWISDFYIFYKK